MSFTQYYLHKWEFSPAASLICLLLGFGYLLPANATTRDPEKLILYLAPDNAQFRKQMASFEAALRKKPLPPYRVEFVPFRQFTHLRTLDQLAEEVAPLVARNPVALVTPNLDIAKAVLQKKIPIQMVVSGVADPVGHGVVRALVNQGVDVTGHVRFVHDIDEKRVSILKEIKPTIKRVGLLMDNFIREQRVVRKAGAFAYQVDGVEVVPLVITSAAEAVAMIGRSKKMGIDGWAIRHMIPNYDDGDATAMVEAVNREQLPAIYDSQRFVRLGGLAAYQAVLHEPDEVWARDIQLLMAGVPARNVPIETPRHFFTVVNTETAARVNVELPSRLMRQVDLAYPCRVKPPLDCAIPTPKLY